MTCEYCFAGKGEYSGEAAIMELETGKRALDWLIENSGTRHNLEVDFFGGEPLLNFDVVKELVSYGRSKEKESGKEFSKPSFKCGSNVVMFHRFLHFLFVAQLFKKYSTNL